MSAREIRVCYFGDSFTAGIGDPDQLGWVGRASIRAQKLGVIVTTYNLGIRRDTSTDVRVRWHAEADARLRSGYENRLVLSFGVNDTTEDVDGSRVSVATSTDNVASILDGAKAASWSSLFVGPVPIADDSQNERIAFLNERFSAICQDYRVPYVDVFKPLEHDPNWRNEVHSGDGAHPRAGGYRKLTSVLFQPWWEWLTR